MDSKVSSPETTSILSNLSGSSSSPIPVRASPYDSDIDDGLKTDALKINNKSSSSSSSSSSSDGGFVSGEEDFVTAYPDEETLEKSMERGNIDAPVVESFVGSSELPKPAMSIAKVSMDDDEIPIVGAFGGEEVEEESGFSSSVSRIEGGSVFEAPGIGAEKVGVQGPVANSEFGGVVSEVDKVSGENLNSAGLGGNQKAAGEVLVANDGDKVFENLKLNEGVSSVVEGSFVPEEQEVESIELKDEKTVGDSKSDVLDENQSAIVTEVKNQNVIKVLEDSARAVFGGIIDLISSNSVESVDNELVEADGVKFTTGGDSVVETMRVNLLGSGAVVGDTEESKESEIKGLEVPVDGSVILDNGSVQTSYDAEEPVHSMPIGVDADFGRKGEPLTHYNVERAEMNHFEPKSEVAGVGKDGKIDTGAAVVDTVREDKQKDIKMDSCADESETVNQVNDEEKPETGIEPQAVSEAKVNKPMVMVAADGGEFASTDKFVYRDGDKIQAVNDIAHSVQTNPASEAKDLENNGAYQPSQVDGLENGVSGKSFPPKSVEPIPILNSEVQTEAENETEHDPDEEGEIEGSVTDGETEGMIFGSPETAKQFLEELEQGSGPGYHSGAESSRDHSQRIDGQIVTDSDEEVDTDEEGDGKELFDSAALAALLKAATGAGSDGGSITITSQDGSRLFSVERPAGLGSSLRPMNPAPRSNRSNLFTPSNFMTEGDSENNLSEEEKKKLEKIQQVRVKFLRLVQKLGHSPEDSIAAQVLYRLALVAGRPTSQSFSLDSAKRTALQLESEGKDELNFSLNILVLGKTGVGKSATINSIFGEEKAIIDAFEPATTTVKEIIGTVDGVKIRVFDTPGLRSSVMEQGVNRKILSSVKKLTKKCPPDIVLYVDRLDTQTRDLNDLPLLRTITSSLGPSIWRSAIVTLTHAASAPPDGPSGLALSYEVFVAQRSHVVQQSIGQAVGDLRLMNPSLMNPVSLVENHPSCRKNRDGQKVLPNGQCWRPQLMMLCYSMKILSEASSLSKPQDPFDHKKLFGFRVRSPPLPYLLSWLLQSRTHPKLSPDQGGENGDSDVDLDDLSDSDQEEDEDEYDQLPPFKPLRKSQIAKLSKEQRKAYFDEYEYRVKLLQKKQWREELKRMREIKKKGKVGADDYSYMGEDIDQENGSPAAVPVPLPDMVLPPSFDCDNPAYRYRFLEPTSQFLARPVLDTHGWDHDCGYDGVNLEQSLAIASQFPAAVSVQITKDKKEFNIHLDSSVSAKHGEDGSSMVGFDIQNIGKQLAYIMRGETKFKNLKKNKTAAGVSVTFLGENVATGFKIEDQIGLGKRLVLVGSAGTVRSQGDAAYGANMEVRLRQPDYPIGQDQSTLGLSLVKWRGDLALGANLQSQFSIGRSSKMAVRVGLNNKLSGQITVRTSSSEQLQIALVGILPIAMAIYKSIWPGVSENYSIY